MNGGDGNNRITGGTDDGTASFINPFPDAGMFTVLGPGDGSTGSVEIIFDGRVDANNNGIGETGVEDEEVSVRVLIRDAVKNLSLINTVTGERFFLGDFEANQVLRFNAGEGGTAYNGITTVFKIDYAIDSFVASDILTGGADADNFTYRLGDGVDEITDFDLNDGDKITLSGIDRSDVRFIDTIDGLVIAFNEATGNDLMANSGILLSNLNSNDFGLDDIIYS